MVTIEEDYVSFEIAKLLKEKGFNERLLTFYITDEAKKEGCFQLMAFTDDKIDNNHSDHCYLAPTLQMAMKWLREVHGVTIVIDTNDIWLGEDNRFYWCKIYYNMGDRIEIKWYNDPSKPNDILRYQTYEEASEEAIKYCLKNLI